jgi:hypothetical protein
MAISREQKSKVIADWQNVLPGLSMFSQNKLYKVVGPVLIGLEFIKLPFSEEYRPHFVIYPLWALNVKACLAYPVVLRQFYDLRGFQYSIPYEGHHNHYRKAFDTVKLTAPLLTSEAVSVKMLHTALDEYSQTPPLSAAPNSYFQAQMQEARIRIALFGDTGDLRPIIKHVDNRCWDEDHFRACGMSSESWLKSLHDLIDNRGVFIRQVQSNRQDQKIAKLKALDLL